MARMQITRGMRIGEAKAYVAERLGVSPFDLSDPIAMEDVRRERQLGRITTFEISYPTRVERDGGQVPDRRTAGPADQLRAALQAARRARVSAGGRISFGIRR